MLPDFGRPRRILLLAVGLVVGLLLTACGGGSDGSAGSTPAGPAAAHNEADVTFATGMIPHHRQAVEMSTLAETRALSQQVKALAAIIKTAQEPEIASMTTWLSAWGAPVPAADGGGHSAGHSGMGMATEAEMQELAGKRGAAFDEVFLTRMIAHHEGAIMMAQEEQRAGQYAPAKELAAMIASTQQSEITQMKELQGLS